MRLPLVAGNWKMHSTAKTCVELCRVVRAGIDGVDGVEKVVCPPFPFLSLAVQELRGSSVKVGAQNMHWEPQGAYTGEVSAPMLVQMVEYVIIGHSERRAYFGESDDSVNRKVKAALTAGLKPIMCVGETLPERERGQTEEVLTRQTRRGLEGVDLPQGFVIAYEPVWAIGTGRPATGPMADEAIGVIREEVAGRYGRPLAESVRILYGGSVTADNIAEFASQEQVDGALVGGASLNGEAFGLIVRRTAEAKAGRR